MLFVKMIAEKHYGTSICFYSIIVATLGSTANIMASNSSKSATYNCMQQTKSGVASFFIRQVKQLLELDDKQFSFFCSQ